MVDYSLEDVKYYLQHGKYPDSFTRRQKKTMWRFSQSCNMKDDVMYIRNRKILLTQEERDEAFIECHASPRGAHCGKNKTLYKLTQRYFFRNMTEFAKTRLKNCDKCQRMEKIKTVAEKLTPIASNNPWEVLGMDLIGPLPETSSGNRYCLTITDLFTKWIEAYPLPSKAAVNIAEHLRTLFFHFGPPKKIITDQGREFVNELNASIFDVLGVKHAVTSAYHPQSNGQDERTNRTIKEALSKVVNDNQDNWDDVLQPVLFGLRSARQDSIKMSPFLAMFGREARLFTESGVAEDDTTNVEERTDARNSDISENPHKEMRLNFMKNVHDSIGQNIKLAQEKQKRNFDKRKAKGIASFKFSCGDKVLKRNFRKIGRKGSKMMTDWQGPYTIAELNEQSVSLQDGNGKIGKRKVNVCHIKPYRAASSANTSCVDKSSAETSCVDKSSADTSCVDKSSAKTPCVDKSSAETSCLDKSSADTSCVDQSSAETSCVDKSSADTSCVDKSSAETSCVDKSCAETSRVDKSSAETSCVDKSSTDTSCVDKSSAETSCVDKSSAETPCVDKSSADTSCVDKSSAETSCVDKSSADNDKDCLITKIEPPENFLFNPVDCEWQTERARAVGLKIRNRIPIPKSSASHYMSVLTPPGDSVKIRGDGNCFFRTLSHVLTGTQSEHLVLRQCVHSYTEQYDKEFSSLLQCNKYSSDSGMQCMGMWATEIEIMATASLLATDMCIYSPSGLDGAGNVIFKWLTYTPLNDVDPISGIEKSDKVLYIANVGQHYVPVYTV